MSKIDEAIKKLQQLHENLNIVAVGYKVYTDDGEIYSESADELENLQQFKLQKLLATLRSKQAEIEK